MKIFLLSLVLFIFISQSASAEMSLFVKDDCSFCDALKVHIETNNLYFKYDIKEYEVTDDQNAALYLEKSKEVGYTAGGLPILIDGLSYIEGNTGISNYLESIDPTTAPSETSLSIKDSESLNSMISSSINENPDQNQQEKSNEEPRDQKTAIIGIITIVFGLTFFATIIYRAKKRLKI